MIRYFIFSELALAAFMLIVGGWSATIGPLAVLGAMGLFWLSGQVGAWFARRGY